MSVESELITLREMAIATNSVMRIMIGLLAKKGLVDVGELVEEIQKVSLAHRANGEEVRAKLLFALSEQILKLPD